MLRLMHAATVALIAALYGGGIGSSPLVVEAARFAPHEQLWQQAATAIAAAEDVSVDDWYAGGGSSAGFAWAWQNANGEFNGRTYDHLNSVVKTRSSHSAQQTSTRVLTNEWLNAMMSVSYELSVDDRSRVNKLTTRGSVLQTQLVVEYERAMGVISDAMRTDASQALAARNFTTFPAHQMLKLDYVVTYQLDFMWSCRARDGVAPRHYHEFQQHMMQFVRAETGLIVKRATDPSLLDVEDIVPSERMRRAFIDMFPCMPTASTTRASLAGLFLQAFVTGMFVFDASLRYNTYPLTATSVLRQATNVIQNPDEAESATNTRVRDIDGKLHTRPAFNVYRDVLDLFNDMKSSTTRRVRTRVATVSIGDTMVASVRMAVRHDGNDFDVSLPEHAPRMSLVTPDNAAKLMDKDKDAGQHAVPNTNYYEECVELELVDGFAMVPVGPATIQITHVNGAFNVTGGGWFDSAPLVGAVANQEEDQNAPMSKRQTSGYHWSVDDFGRGHDFSDGGNFGIAGAHLITSLRSFSSQCRGRTFTDAQAASLRDAMNRAGDASFAGWTSGRGVLDEKAGGFPVREWDDGAGMLQYSLRDIKASLAATAALDPAVAAALLGTDGQDGGMKSGVSVNVSPPPQVISEPAATATADVLATRIVWPGVDANAFQPTRAAVNSVVSGGSPTPTDKPHDDGDDDTVTKHDGYSVSVLAIACAGAVLVGVCLGMLIQRKCRGSPSVSQGLLSSQFDV